MIHKGNSEKRSATRPDYQASDIKVAILVGRVFEDAAAIERGRILVHLVKPLGVLSLVAVANGIFAKIWFRGGWPSLSVRSEDLLSVQANDVTSLVDFVEQVSVETVDGLAQMMTSSEMAGSSAAALLETTLVHRAGRRRRSP